MELLLDETVHVHYGQIYVQSTEKYPDLAECFAGQRNGLCGAAVPGYLFLITGLHTGSVGFTVLVHESEPPVDDSWEDIVEASFRPDGDTALVQWAGENWWPLALPVTDYRVRYSGKGMQAAREKDTTLQGEPLIDRYFLEFWPAPAGEDRVVKQTSAIAAYWHGYAQQQPPPPPPPTPEEVAEAERLAELAQQRQARERLEAEELRRWDGVLPSDRLRALPGAVLTIAGYSRALVDALDAATPETQRAVARWVTRRTCVEARLDSVAWIANALALMDHGQPLPSLFNDHARVWNLLFSDPSVPHTLTTSPDGRTDNCSQQAMALPALFSADVADPLAAAFDALWAGVVTFGYGRYEVLFEEVRAAFPVLRARD